MTHLLILYYGKKTEDACRVKQQKKKVQIETKELTMYRLCVSKKIRIQILKFVHIL